MPGFGCACVLEKVRWLVVGSTAVILSGSTTSTGKPGTAEPATLVRSGCHAYTWRSALAAMMSRLPSGLPSRWASTGEARKPRSVRSRGPSHTMRLVLSPQ